MSPFIPAEWDSLVIILILPKDVKDYLSQLEHNYINTPIFVYYPKAGFQPVGILYPPAPAQSQR